MIVCGTELPVFLFSLDLAQSGWSNRPRVANTPRELGLLAGAFLVGLGTLEVVLHASGF